MCGRRVCWSDTDGATSSSGLLRARVRQQLFGRVDTKTVEWERRRPKHPFWRLVGRNKFAEEVGVGASRGRSGGKRKLDYVEWHRRYFESASSQLSEVGILNCSSLMYASPDSHVASYPSSSRLARAGAEEDDR